jgi:hypothetical protein
MNSAQVYYFMSPQKYLNLSKVDFFDESIHEFTHLGAL